MLKRMVKDVMVKYPDVDKQKLTNKVRNQITSEKSRRIKAIGSKQMPF